MGVDFHALETAVTDTADTLGIHWFRAVELLNRACVLHSSAAVPSEAIVAADYATRIPAADSGDRQGTFRRFTEYKAGSNLSPNWGIWMSVRDLSRRGIHPDELDENDFHMHVAWLHGLMSDLPELYSIPLAVQPQEGDTPWPEAWIASRGWAHQSYAVEWNKVLFPREFRKKLPSVQKANVVWPYGLFMSRDIQGIFSTRAWSRWPQEVAPTVVRWVPKVADFGLREELFRKLAYSELVDIAAGTVWSELLSMPSWLPDVENTLAWSLGHAAGVLATPDRWDDIVRVVADERFGSARLALVHQVPPSVDLLQEWVDALIVLKDDPFIRMDVLFALRHVTHSRESQLLAGGRAAEVRGWLESYAETGSVWQSHTARGLLEQLP